MGHHDFFLIAVRFACRSEHRRLEKAATKFMDIGLWIHKTAAVTITKLFLFVTRADDFMDKVPRSAFNCIWKGPRRHFQSL